MKSIDGQMFKRMMISGSNNLYNHYPEIDALNVFPVPDGDTGMNMNLTLSSGAKEILNRTDTNFYDIAKAFSRGLLMGARGNSGVITSQIFRGFAQSAEGKSECRAIDLAEAFVNGKEVSYKAVMRPVEGTILTVIRESSAALMSAVDEDTSIEKAMEILIEEAKKSLEHTPELLPVLKEVGVVDSGGAGLVKILEGMQSALLGKMIDKSEPSVSSSSIEKPDGNGGDDYKVSYTLALGYGIGKKEIDLVKFRNFINGKGTNVDINPYEKYINVTLVTKVPGAVITYSSRFGEFKNIEITKVTPIEDEISNDEPLKDFGLIAVSVGDGLDQIFKDIGVDYIVSGGQTMNPSTEDFIGAIKKVHAKNVFILPNNSNIVLAASQACEVIEGDVNARVVPSKTIPQGLVASMTFNPEVSADENFEEMKASLKNVDSGSITYAIKDTDIDGVHVTKDYYMGIKDKSILVCEKDKYVTLFGLIEQMITKSSSICTIIYGEDVSEDDIPLIERKLNKKYPLVDFDIRKGNQPVYSFLIGVED